MPLVDAGVTMQDVILVMSEKRFGCVGVIDLSGIYCIITDGDLRRTLVENLLTFGGGRHDTIASIN